MNSRATYAETMALLDEQACDRLRRDATKQARAAFWAAIDPLLAGLSPTERAMVTDALTPGLEVLQGIRADEAEDEWKRDE